MDSLPTGCMIAGCQLIPLRPLPTPRVSLGSVSRDLTDAGLTKRLRSATRCFRDCELPSRWREARDLSRGMSGSSAPSRAASLALEATSISS